MDRALLGLGRPKRKGRYCNSSFQRRRPDGPHIPRHYSKGEGLKDLIRLPKQLPPHPRGFVTGADIDRIRALKDETWVRVATSRLLECVDTEYEPVGHLGAEAHPEKNSVWIYQSILHALAFHRSDDQKYL